MCSADLSTIGRVGVNNLSVQVVPREIEQYNLNNAINLSGTAIVEADNTNPLLDVTFDGVYILDGDIVSPTPRILVKLHDDNPYLFKSDTSGINLELKRPCEGCDYEHVSMAGSSVVYTEASAESDFEIEYNPGPLEDGG